MRSRPFILLDLTSQADYIPHEVHRWPRRQIFAWLRQYGDVVKFPVRTADTLYGFRTGSCRMRLASYGRQGTTVVVGADDEWHD